MYITTWLWNIWHCPYLLSFMAAYLIHDVQNFSKRHYDCTTLRLTTYSICKASNEWLYHIRFFVYIYIFRHKAYFIFWSLLTAKLLTFLPWLSSFTTSTWNIDYCHIIHHAIPRCVYSTSSLLSLLQHLRQYFLQ